MWTNDTPYISNKNVRSVLFYERKKDRNLENMGGYDIFVCHCGGGDDPGKYASGAEFYGKGEQGAYCDRSGAAVLIRAK